MTQLVDLTVALSSYDHTLDLTKGEVKIAGTRPNFIELPIPEMFRRVVRYRDWDVSEVSLVDYVMLRAAGDDELVAIPIFTSRMFCHRSIYVRSDRIREPLDLRGGRIGVPAWADSTGVWARGLLSDMYGVTPNEIEWWETDGENPPCAPASDASAAPLGVKVQRSEDRGLEDLIWAGDLDAVIVADAPRSLRRSAESGGMVQRLFSDLGAAERAYYARTRCLPPLHTVAIRRDVLDAHPWVAGNLYRAFEVAKRRYLVRLTEISASRTAIPWAAAYVAGAQAILGEELWPYGADANRTSIDVLLRYCADQGLLEQPISADALFAPVEPFVDGLI